MVKGFYNIYVDNNLLQLVSTDDLGFISLLDDSQKLVSFTENKKALTTSLEELAGNKFKRIVVHASSEEVLYAELTKICTPVEAAGGLVVNEREEILAIFRRGSWDLPKGKMELDEKRKAAAIREVKEECGVDNIEITTKLGTTYHTFGPRAKRKLKISHWYSMSGKKQKLTPQKAEDITEAKWVSLKDFMLKCTPVYPNILDVIDAYVLKKDKVL